MEHARVGAVVLEARAMLYPSRARDLAADHRILAALRDAAFPQDNRGALAREFEDVVMASTSVLVGYAQCFRVIVVQSARG
eukprot:547368-Lingulodinium_polyedra.AAC.1